MSNATVRRLPLSAAPWAWAVHIGATDRDIFTALLDDLKESIPARSRRWEPSSREWLIRDIALEPVENLLRRYGLAIRYADEGAVHRQLGRADALAALYLTADAPDFLIPVVYRTLAKHYHPDTPTGGTAQMQRLNAAMGVLK